MSNLKKAMEYRKLVYKLQALLSIPEECENKKFNIAINDLDIEDIEYLIMSLDDMADNKETAFWDDYEYNKAKDIKQLLNDNPDCNDIFVSVDEIFLK